MCIYIKPQLQLTDADYLQITVLFESLNTADSTEFLGLSVKSLGYHLHILHSITLLEHICGWSTNSPLLDYFLHLGGNPMIVLGDILMCDDVQHTVSLLLDSVGSPSIHTHQHSSYSNHILINQDLFTSHLLNHHNLCPLVHKLAHKLVSKIPQHTYPRYLILQYHLFHLL